ncbi:hypothetical protein ACLOJK_028760 [Asimina triloba]
MLQQLRLPQPRSSPTAHEGEQLVTSHRRRPSRGPSHPASASSSTARRQIQPPSAFAHHTSANSIDHEHHAHHVGHPPAFRLSQQHRLPYKRGLRKRRWRRATRGTSRETPARVADGRKAITARPGKKAVDGQGVFGPFVGRSGDNHSIPVDTILYMLLVTTRALAESKISSYQIFGAVAGDRR